MQRGHRAPSRFRVKALRSRGKTTAQGTVTAKPQDRARDRARDRDRARGRAKAKDKDKAAADGDRAIDAVANAMSTVSNVARKRTADNRRKR
jgi:hypothetical protein